VLAKEFVVDALQLPLLRAAGADAVLLLAALHPPKQLARLVEQSLRIGLEPFVEAHDERELRAALATDTRMIGLNNRDLRTLDVDTERAVRLRPLVPDDRLVVAESGVRDASTIAGWRAVGFDAALVGEMLVRSTDPEAAARTFVAAGCHPADLVNAATEPFVKICGVVDADGVGAALRTGADAIGLNLVPGTPRALLIDEAVSLARLVREVAPPPRRPRIVLVTVDGKPDDLNAVARATGADAIQLNGKERPTLINALERPAWKVLHLPADGSTAGDSAADLVAHARAWLAAGAERILLDTAGGPHPGGTGRRAAVDLAAAVAREVPVVLAGGLNAANVGAAVRDVPAVGVDVA
jgi:phosphoribosylanthranilate isomerase